MKRFHVHVSVDNLEQAAVFYERMFGTPATVRKDDYAKWMLDDPRVNFAISQRGRAPGVDHLGIQVESKDELREVYGRMDAAGHLLQQGETTCCYARSEKSWVHDPQGIPWEAFHTTGEATTYGEGADTAMADAAASACCVPLAPAGRSKLAMAPESACCVPGAAADKTTGSCC